MADKTVNELPRAATVTTADLFVLEQGGQAKSLTGQVLINDLATALDGHGGINSITLNDDYTLTFTLADETTVTTTSVRGSTGAKGDKGADGRSITNVSKTGTAGLVDTYKITFSDNTHSTFTVANGASIKSIAKTGTAGLVDTYKVTLTNNATSTFTVTNGNGIATVELQSGTHAAGTSDVYKITFDNGQYTTFSVYNGMNGTGATSTVNNKSPDENGNVTLTASDVGAASDGDLQILNETLETKINQKQDTTGSLTLGSQTDLITQTYFPILNAKDVNKKIQWVHLVNKILETIFGPIAVSPAGILKGGRHTGSWIISVDSLATDDITDGAVTRAKLAQDALSSPIQKVAGSVALSQSDIGKTLLASSNSTVVFTITKEASDTMPDGAEIAIMWYVGDNAPEIKTSSGIMLLMNDKAYGAAAYYKIRSKFGLVALKKLEGTSPTYWTILGDVEVVE